MIELQPFHHGALKFCGECSQFVGFCYTDRSGDIVFRGIPFGAAGIQIVGILRPFLAQNQGQGLKGAIMSQIFFQACNPLRAIGCCRVSMQHCRRFQTANPRSGHVWNPANHDSQCRISQRFGRVSSGACATSRFLPNHLSSSSLPRSQILGSCKTRLTKTSAPAVFRCHSGMVMTWGLISRFRL